jgi:type IV pilus assembly protein PilB
LLKGLTAAYKELGDEALTPEGGTDLERAAYLTLGIAERMRASDIHVHGSAENLAVIRIRVDGVLHTVARFDRRLLGPFVEQWKVLTNVDLSEKPVSLDGHAMLTVNDVPLDVRSSFVQTALGEAVTFRILARVSIDSFRLETLELSSDARERLAEQMRAPSGLIVVTGPTGCGRTTTLYSALASAASPKIKVMTAEEPVEMLLENVVQVPVRPDMGMSFPAVLTRIFRSDPDVVMVGEVRDRDTLDICCKAAMAGHLVLMGLQVPSSVEALYQMGSLLNDANLTLSGNALRLVVAQRLLRKVCPECARPQGDLAAGLLAEVKARALQGGVDFEALPKQFRVAQGCKRCGKTGYCGRLAVGEALTVTPEILQALRSGAAAREIEKIAIEQGMVTLPAQGIRAAASGATTLDEVFRVFR